MTSAAEIVLIRFSFRRPRPGFAMSQCYEYRRPQATRKVRSSTIANETLEESPLQKKMPAVALDCRDYGEPDEKIVTEQPPIFRKLPGCFPTKTIST